MSEIIQNISDIFSIISLVFSIYCGNFFTHAKKKYFFFCHNFFLHATMRQQILPHGNCAAWHDNSAE